MKLQRWLPWLVALLVAQLALTLWLWRDDAMPAAVATTSLLSFDPAVVDGIEISDGKRLVQLRKIDGQWQLPAVFDFPAAGFRVDDLLTALSAVRPGLAVATTPEAAQRFRVAEDGYERLVQLQQGDVTLAKLYLGDAAGPRRAYARLDGDTAIYSLDFTAYQADADANSWTDKTWLHRSLADITGLQMRGIQLLRAGDGWQLAGLAEGESTDQAAAAALVARLADLNFMAVIGPATTVPKGQVLLALSLQLGKDRAVQYRFIDPGQQGDPLLWVSDRDHVLRIASYTFKSLTDVTREKLIQVAGTSPPAGEPAEGGAGGGGQ